MALRPEYTLHQSEFGCFLYAPIREDDEAPLSVLSVLARLDIDPWAEAARLAALPRDAAAASLAAILARLPRDTRGSLDDIVTADRLIGLLPRAGSAPSVRGEGGGPPQGRDRSSLMDARYWVVLALLAVLTVSVAYLS